MSLFRSQPQPAPLPEGPVEQLKLVGAEVNRQLDAAAAKRTGLHARAGGLVAAAGALTAVQATDWASGWQIISAVLSVVAAILGLWILRPVPLLNVDATKYVKERLAADPYRTEKSIVDDNIVVLGDLTKYLRTTAPKLRTGYYVLIAAWLATLTVSALSQVRWI